MTQEEKDAFKKQVNFEYAPKQSSSKKPSQKAPAAPKTSAYADEEFVMSMYKRNKQRVQEQSSESDDAAAASDQADQASELTLDADLVG